MSLPPEPTTTSWAEGEARLELLGAPAHLPADCTIARAHFRDGAFTRWHVHEGVQVLHFIDGGGFVEMKGRRPIKCGPGETVTIPPRTWHRHGAAPNGSASHLSVTWGDTDWA